MSQGTNFLPSQGLDMQSDSMPGALFVVRGSRQIDCAVLTLLGKLDEGYDSLVRGWCLKSSGLSANWLSLRNSSCKLCPSTSYTLLAVKLCIGLRNGRCRTMCVHSGFVGCHPKQPAIVKVQSKGRQPHCRVYEGTGPEYCKHVYMQLKALRDKLVK
jgi:hypothetical protein